MRRSLTWSPGRRSLRAFRAISVTVFLAIVLGNAGQPALAGAPLYPDIVTLPPSGLYIERNNAGHYLVRFANTAANLGGRLEIAVLPGTRQIYQNVYDQYIGGNRVVREQVHSDLIYHPQHNHFHFTGFAQYELLRKDNAGFYKVTNRAGSKTTFCILDTMRVNSNGPTNPAYNTCGANFQGLSAGWGDTYIAALFDQWIDVGTTPLADGQYAIRSTADPDNRLMETNDFNNIGITYFSIVNGRISGLVNPPLCQVEPAGGGVATADRPAETTVGQAVRLSCTRFEPDEIVDIYWGSVNTEARAAVKATSSGALAAFVEIPPSALGVHYWIAKGRSSGTQAAAIVNTVPSVEVTPARGEVNSKATATIRGFASGEPVQVRVYKSGSVVATTLVLIVSGSGSGEIDFPIPTIPFGAHKVEAIGQESGARATGSLVTTPTIELTTDEADTGEEVGVELRSFVPGETVTVTIGPAKIVVAELIPSHSGSTSGSSAKFVVPAIPSGDYLVFATGSVSGVAVSAEIAVDANGASEDPSATPTTPPETTATETATEAPVETETAEATEAPVNASPIAAAGDDQTVIDSDNSGTEDVHLVGSASYDPDGTVLTYEWSLDGTVLSGDTDPVLDLPVGTHLITLAIVDGFGATAMDDVVIDVIPPPTEIATGSPEP